MKTHTVTAQKTWSYIHHLKLLSRSQISTKLIPSIASHDTLKHLHPSLQNSPHLSPRIAYIVEVQSQCEEAVPRVGPSSDFRPVVARAELEGVEDQGEVETARLVRGKGERVGGIELD